jgi:hypothetical protein
MVVMRVRSLFTTASIAAVSVLTLTAAPATAKDKFCDPLKGAAAKIKAMGSASADPATMGKTLADVAATMKSIEGKAPSAIKADWSKMATGITKLSDITNKMLNLKAADAAKKLPALQKEMATITDDKSFTVSGDKVTVWAKKNCGIDLDA